MSENFVTTLVVSVVAFFGIWGYIGSEKPEEETNYAETTSWSEDTSSDYPTYTDYVDSDYVDDRGTDECTEDCGGHSAGYDWAYENDVCDEDFDGGNSESFAEGVREYAIENC